MLDWLSCATCRNGKARQCAPCVGIATYDIVLEKQSHVCCDFVLVKPCDACDVLVEHSSVSFGLVLAEWDEVKYSSGNVT